MFQTTKQPNSHGKIKNVPNHETAISILWIPMVKIPAEFRLPRLRDSLVALAQDPANVLTLDWNSDLSQATKIPSIPKGSQLISRY